MPLWWSEPTSENAFTLAWISVVLTLIAAAAGIGFYGYTGSALCLVFGLENCVDFLSSVVVLWRFYCPGGLTKEREALLLKREKRASMAISIILMLLGFGVVISAADDLAKGAEGAFKLEFVLIIAFFSIFVFGGLTLVKFKYANSLSSASLYKDGICSLIGTVMASALFVNTLIIDHFPTVWYLDPIVALLCGVGALAIGLYAIVEASCIQGIPIFSVKWWLLSQGDGMDEMGARELGPDDFGTEDNAGSSSPTNEGGVELGSSPSPSSGEKSDTQLSEVV